MADSKITGLTQASALADADEIAVAQSGVSKAFTPIEIDKFHTKSLGADQSNSTTTLTKVTGLDLTLPAGTYVFQYFVRYQAAATSTGVRFSVNHSGTVTFLVANIRWVDASATASTATPDHNAVQAAGHVMGSFAARATSTTGWGTTLGVDTINADMLMIVEGLVLVTASGDLQLYHGSEVAAASTCKIGSSLIVRQIA